MTEDGTVASRDYVILTAGGQAFGLPIHRVRDVFVAGVSTPVPFAPEDIVGLFNLRGRVVTAMSLRRRLGLPRREPLGGEPAIVIEDRGESYALLVDSVTEVRRLGDETRAEKPAHLDRRWLDLAESVHRLPDELLLILDVDAVLSVEAEPCAGPSAA